MCRLFALICNALGRRKENGDPMTAQDFKPQPEAAYADEDEHTEIVWNGFVRAFGTQRETA